jgi:hypothetical protein
MPTAAVPGRRQNVTTHNPVHRLPVFLLCLVEIILAACGTALLFLLVAGINQIVSAFFLELATGAAIGIVTGLYSRSLFSRSILFMRFMVMLLSTLLGLIAFHLVSRFVFGISNLSLTIPEWLILVQAILAAIVGGMALVAWKKERLAHLRRVANQRRIRREQNKRKRLSARRKSEVLRRKRSASRTHPAQPTANRSKTTPTRTRSRTSKQPKTGVSSIPTTLQLGGSRSRKKVTLPGRMVEHRCPYCLEPVAQNDARGVKICSVCGAWHHQDCWDITGHCQVPHRGNGA